MADIVSARLSGEPGQSGALEPLGRDGELMSSGLVVEAQDQQRVVTDPADLAYEAVLRGMARAFDMLALGSGPRSAPVTPTAVEKR